MKNKYPEELSNLITLVSMDDLTTEDSILKNYAHENNITVFDIKQVEKLGEINQLDPIPPTPETEFTITFTSGTTGANPKGVVLTHKNAAAGVTFLYCNFMGKENVRFYSFLPLAHIYERANIQFALSLGSAIGFPQGPSPLTLLDDVKVLKPDLLALVPRVYTKLEAAIRAQTINNMEKPWLQSIFLLPLMQKWKLMPKRK